MKLLITSTVPKIVADIVHIVAAKMLHNNFKIRGVKDALMALQQPRSPFCQS
jgi:hypothetical protein